jgi:uncharacterized protein (DUF1015 family)
MTKIHPFKAIRPTRDKAQLVSTRPLAAYSKSVLQKKLVENPYSFLHVIHPDDIDGKLAKVNSVERFEAVKYNLSKFIEEGVFIQEQEPSFYIYRQTKEQHVFTGIIAGVSLDDYDNNKVKKHEATITSREAMFTNYLDITGFNFEPVLLVHKHNLELADHLAKITAQRPEYDFSTTDKIRHELWVAPAANHQFIQQVFEQIPELYIADGHHRSASSSLLLSQLEAQQRTVHPNQRYFLSYLLDEQVVEILEFQRLVKTLNGLNPEQFLEACSVYFEIEPITELTKPTKKHHFTCVLSDCIYLFKLKHEFIDDKDVIGTLDAHLITKYLLSPILGINDLKTSKEIEFIAGNVALDKISDMIQSGEFAVGFLLFPSSIEEIMAVSNENQIMPPKSTWVEPKLRSGLTIYKLNE